MKGQKGITLVALIITIIVMLILVSVVIAVVINSNLLGTAKKAVDDTNASYANEQNFGEQFNYKGNYINVYEIDETTTF